MSSVILFLCYNSALYKARLITNALTASRVSLLENLYLVRDYLAIDIAVKMLLLQDFAIFFSWFLNLLMTESCVSPFSFKICCGVSVKQMGRSQIKSYSNLTNEQVKPIPVYLLPPPHTLLFSVLYLHELILIIIASSFPFSLLLTAFTDVILYCWQNNNVSSYMFMHYP